MNKSHTLRPLNINTNALIREILVFPERYQALIAQLDKSEVSFVLARLKRAVSDALAADPPSKRGRKLRLLHAEIERDQDALWAHRQDRSLEVIETVWH